MKILFISVLLFIAPQIIFAQLKSVQKNIWSADNGDGTYTNPIIHADYSDPDAIRVKDDFYMIASSFNAAPGLPILHSKDLVNWTIIGYALQQQFPIDEFSKVQHGNGVWAPSIRFHNNVFYIFFPDPDQGIFVTKASKITGPWSTPKMVEAGKGLIDPCPLWDDDGTVFLVHAYAGSRAGFKSILVIKEMNAMADSVIGNAVLVYDGHEKDPTVEGPKLYKRNNYYYIFAPAGGVSTGWQIVLRSKNIYGPYERKIVMAQGKSLINGPHQGAWVNTISGQDWFLHFQDKDAYGRIVHLQPMAWKNDWPIIGIDDDGDGIGDPVSTFKKPNTGYSGPIQELQNSDEFNESKLGLQWQWQANPQQGWAFTSTSGTLRMNCLKPDQQLKNYWMLPNFLAQKLPAETFYATTKINFSPKNVDDKIGLMTLGADYAYISLTKKVSGNFISHVVCKDADKDKSEIETVLQKINNNSIYLRASVTKDGVVEFAYSEDGKSFIKLTDTLKLKPGRWVGAKIGLFATASTKTNDAGYAHVDWFRFSKD